MTNDELNKIDAETAKKIMDWKLVFISYQAAWIPAADDLKTFKTIWYAKNWVPSENVDCALRLIEKIGQWHGFDFCIHRQSPSLKWEVGWMEQCNEPEWRIHAEHESLPMAICLAALKTVEAK